MNQVSDHAKISHHTLSRVPYTEATREIIEGIKIRLAKSQNLHLPLEKTLSLLEDLAQFELGRFLLHNKGLNGYWTSYIFRARPENKMEHPLEEWLLHRSLLVLARERFSTFQQEIQKRLKSDACFASLPCGLMDDLLLLDYTGLENIRLVGIDADTESLEFANENSKKQGLQPQCQFLHRDAWNLGINEEFDLISSNGLNMYESSEERLIQLYDNFYKALKPNGTLVVSFLPPPPAGIDPNDVVKKFGMDLESFKQDRAIFDDIIQITYLNFCTEEQMINQLNQVGFKIHEIRYNSNGVAPVAIAYK